MIWTNISGTKRATEIYSLPFRCNRLQKNLIFGFCRGKGWQLGLGLNDFLEDQRANRQTMYFTPIKWENAKNQQEMKE